MKARFLHIADCHLGYKQYNHKERFNDFARAFQSVINVAIEKKVDFVVLAGDLFQKRAIDALTLNQAMMILETLHKAEIPCIAVEGNHEQAYYADFIGWMEFLAQRELLKLLDVQFKDGSPQLTEYTKRQGSFIDPIPGLRIHGLGYRGAGTAKAVELYAKAMEKQPNKEDIHYTIFAAHAGVEGVLSGQSGGLSYRQWSVLRPHVDYLALGHIHKPFEFEDWIYNPGSPETCSIVESAWSDRGYYLVEVDTEQIQVETQTENKVEAEDGAHEIKHVTTRGANRRRPFHRYSVKVDLHTTPETLYDYCRSFLERKASDISAKSRNGRSAQTQPVVELQLTGVLPFDRGALNIEHLKEMVEESFQPLIPLVRNLTQSADFGIDLNEDTLSRVELEHQVLTDLLERDARFQEKSVEWAAVVRQMKTMALNDISPDAILSELASHLEKLTLEKLTNEKTLNGKTVNGKMDH